MAFLDFPLFPEIARKTPPSLRELGIREVSSLIAQACEVEDITVRELKETRKYLRQGLPFSILTELFERFFPRDVWSYPCADKRFGQRCSLHWECRLANERMPMLIEVLFSEDIEHVNVCLWKTSNKLQKNALKSFYNVFTKKPARDFPLLTSFVLQGRGWDRDILTLIEELTNQLLEKAPNLENLHLPVASNIVLSSVSRMKSLRAFYCERSVNLGKRGLRSLCAVGSVSKYKLEVCHIGIYRHKYFEKEDGSLFLRNMEGLKEFSFLDSDRRLLRTPWEVNKAGDKVFSYSVFKLAIKRSEQNESVRWPDGRVAPEPLATDLRELCVVDRSLKPHYILESAPKLSRLSIDWQEELSTNGEDRYEVDWFSQMLRKPAWITLASRLTKLDITFPAAHSPNRYGLPLQDYVALMTNLNKLTSLRLVGAGMMGPFPLIPTFKYCPMLEELELVKTPIHLPGEMDSFRPEYTSKYLRKFRLLDEFSSMTQHEHLTRTVSRYMPSLVELDIQPQIVYGYNGQTIRQVKELSRLESLERLSIPLSLVDCNSNMPSVIYMLKDFKSLRHLILSWACSSTEENYSTITSRHQISFLMKWLYMALGANNANINVQLSGKHHAQEYSSPVYQQC